MSVGFTFLCQLSVKVVIVTFPIQKESVIVRRDVGAKGRTSKMLQIFGGY